MRHGPKTFLRLPSEKLSLLSRHDLGFEHEPSGAQEKVFLDKLSRHQLLDSPALDEDASNAQVTIKRERGEADRESILGTRE
jgi:hypothetical protein